MKKLKIPAIQIKESILNHFIQGVIVFASVFLAFWLTEVRENSKSEKEVEIALKSIALELSHNHNRIVYTFNYHYKISQQIDSIANQNPDTFGELHGFQLKAWHGVQLPMLRSTAYKTITNSGLVSKLNFETQKSLADIYSVQKLIEDADNSIIELTINDLEFTKLRKVRHLSSLYLDILPDVIGFYQKFGYPLLKDKGYTQQLDDGKLKSIVDEKISQI
ncbi:MAG: hypothetical protein KG029_13920 [Bacteroidetes bacterium]|nr:hypothetical protein [Bacteroidota bacterium]